MTLRWLIGCVVVAATAMAHAQTAPRPPELQPGATLPRPPGMAPSLPAPPDEEEVEYDHYGLQIAAADLVSMALLTNGAAKPGVVLYALDGPIIHALHGQGWRAVASLALRVGLPLALVGYGEGHGSGCAPDDWDCGEGGDGQRMVAATIAGAIAAIVDDTLLAQRVLRPSRSAKSAGATWSPQLAVSSRLTSLGVVARF